MKLIPTKKLGCEIRDVIINSMDLPIIENVDEQPYWLVSDRLFFSVDLDIRMVNEYDID